MLVLWDTHIIKYAKKRDKYFIKRLFEEGLIGESAVSKLIKKVSVDGNFGRDTILYSNSFSKSNELMNALILNNCDFNQFKGLIKCNWSEDVWDDITISMMKNIRESVPQPTNNTLMSKVFPADDIEKYFAGTYRTVGGYVTKADDVANCTSYMDYYNNLGLGYKPIRFYKDADDCLGVIRFKSDAVPNSLEIPYGTSFGGNTSRPLPYTGTGFAGETASTCITPEFEVSGYIEVLDGAELYKITQDGDEVLMGVYNKDKYTIKGDKGCFERLEDIS